MKAFEKSCVLAALGVVVLIGCSAKEEAAAPEPAAMEEPEEQPAAPAAAVAKLQPRAGTEITGSVSFTEVEGGVQVMVHIEGAAPGAHGIHLHELGDCSSEDFKSTGGHFNPTGAPHGAPGDAEHHAGDFGNVEVGEDGVGHVELVSDMLTVAEGPNTVVGRGVILHEKADDLVSQPTGDAGGRIACGVVELWGANEGDDHQEH